MPGFGAQFGGAISTCRLGRALRGAAIVIVEVTIIALLTRFNNAVAANCGNRAAFDIKTEGYANIAIGETTVEPAKTAPAAPIGVLATKVEAFDIVVSITVEGGCATLDLRSTQESIFEKVSVGCPGGVYFNAK